MESANGLDGFKVESTTGDTFDPEFDEGLRINSARMWPHTHKHTFALRISERTRSYIRVRTSVRACTYVRDSLKPAACAVCVCLCLQLTVGAQHVSRTTPQAY